jgi:D-sedoheptulose 7-phosphate isomerase
MDNESQQQQSEKGASDLAARAQLTLLESARLKVRMAEGLADQIAMLAQRVIATYKNGGRVLVFGNGGSAADATHLASELVGRYDRDRKALAALALTTDTPTMTSISNDFGYEQVFARQIEAHAKPNDLVIGITTSGKSKNVIAAIEAARKIPSYTVALSGRDGGPIASLADMTVVVPSQVTARIQEGHAAIIHIICELVDHWLLG